MTLINYMETEGESEIELRNEEKFGLGTTSVSWHSDSSLRENSTVAVYHTYRGAREKRLASGAAGVERGVRGALRAFGG